MKTNGKAPTFRTHHNTNTMNFRLTLVASSVLLGGALLTGCKGGETLTPNQAGEVEILEYCAGEEFRSDKNTFRATATGESMSREAAKKMARSNAEARLARSINATIEVVTDNYINSSSFNNKEEMTETFNELARTVVDQQLSGAITACDRLTQKADGNYVSYIAIELSGADLVSKYNERLSQDERIRAEYNYEKFKETFEAEMDKLR
jgi:hypothetical protein